jgi:hypothetical protein
LRQAITWARVMARSCLGSCKPLNAETSVTSVLCAVAGLRP